MAALMALIAWHGGAYNILCSANVKLHFHNPRLQNCKFARGMQTLSVYCESYYILCRYFIVLGKRNDGICDDSIYHRSRTRYDQRCNGLLATTAQASTVPKTLTPLPPRVTVSSPRQLPDKTPFDGLIGDKCIHLTHLTSLWAKWFKTMVHKSNLSYFTTRTSLAKIGQKFRWYIFHHADFLLKPQNQRVEKKSV